MDFKYTKIQRRKIRKNEQRRTRVEEYQKKKRKFRKQQQKRTKMLSKKKRAKIEMKKFLLII
jgi:hypothetical protein